jgi:hypothetical protein
MQERSPMATELAEGDWRSDYALKIIHNLLLP